ncbi:hypothetical protein B9Z19DRAFT_1096738 [Tuber borchii]|uniref:Uncharacterized protein n=1 Tax=Tuber borchii TaxID=42251 RepID=A0A2T6ZB31_TUBBO|nr:hypothetical protein B9Z19DRAFT_1096738 [Tuber borchii]
MATRIRCAFLSVRGWNVLSIGFMTDHSRVSCVHLLLLLFRMVGGAVKDMALCFSGEFCGGGSVGVLSHCDIFFARGNRGVWARMGG